MDITEEINIILEEKDISKILTKYNELNLKIKQFEEIKDMLKSKAIAHLKERKWDNYFDEDTKIQVKISNMKREIIDKKALQQILKPSDYAQIVTIRTSERVTITTEETRKKMSKFLDNKG